MARRPLLASMVTCFTSIAVPVGLRDELRRRRRHRKEPFHGVVQRLVRQVERQRLELARLRAEVGRLGLPVRHVAVEAVAVEG